MGKLVLSRSALLFSVIIGVLPIFASLIFKNFSYNEELNNMKDYVLEKLIIQIPVHISYGDEGFNFPDLSSAVQTQIHIESARLFGKRWNIEIYDELQQFTSNTSKSKGAALSEFSVELHYGQENYLLVDSKGIEAQLVYDVAAVHSNDLPFYITQTILHHLVNQEINAFKAAKSYNETYTTLNIVLIHEDDSTISEDLLLFIKNKSSFLYDNLNITIMEQSMILSDLNNNSNTIYIIEDELRLSYLIRNKSSILLERIDPLNIEDLNLLWESIHSEIIGLLGNNPNEQNLAEAMGLSKYKTLELTALLIDNLQRKISKNIITRLKLRTFIKEIKTRLYDVIETLDNGRQLDWDNVTLALQELHQQVSFS